MTFSSMLATSNSGDFLQFSTLLYIIKDLSSRLLHPWIYCYAKVYIYRNDIDYAKLS